MNFQSQMLFLKLRGLSSLLQNNPELTLSAGEEEPTKGKEKLPQPDEQARARRYLTPDGNFYMPAPAIRKCLLTAARKYRVKPETGSLRVSAATILAGNLGLTDVAFPLLDENDQPIPGDRYEVNVQRVVIKATKASIWRGRPKIWPWYLLCWLSFDSSRIELELVKRIADDAGVYPGLGDYRPERGGWFGTFEVIKIWCE